MDWLIGKGSIRQTLTQGTWGYKKNPALLEGAAHLIHSVIWEHNDSALTALRLMEQAREFRRALEFPAMFPL